MNDKNLDVLTNIIGAVESGGQVYGKRRYNAYTPPKTNSKKETTITIGWAQCFDHEARQLIQSIYDADQNAFKKLDTCSPTIYSMLSKNWGAIRWNPSKSQKEVIIKLIDSPIGHKVQDEIFKQKMIKLCADCAADYTKDEKAQMMYCEIRHLGGRGPTNRIFNRCKGDYSLDRIMTALVQDQRDITSDNQVGDTKYWSRHVKCRQFIDQYYIDESASVEAPKKEETPMAITEKDITICGHGSGNPRTTRMDSYGTLRYAGTASGTINGKKQTWHKGLVAVVRRKQMTDSQRKQYVATYKTILGRNKYSNDLRNYVFSPYKDGNYYSDCSSSQNATLTRVGLKTPALTTVEMYNSNLFEKLPAKIVNGHMTNPEILQIGDMLLYAGTNVKRTLHIGHVEGVYAIKGSTINTDTASNVKASAVSGPVAEFQKFLNTHYKAQFKTELVIDGEYGTKTRNAAVAVWKYMANKYYNANLTVGNTNFLGACKQAAAKMTDAEIDKHPTLAYILQGVLAGRGYYKNNFDGEIGPKSKAAIKAFQKDKKLTQNGSMSADVWYALFN